MKEIIGQIIEKLEAIFLPKRVKQPETEKANGSTRKLQRFLTERFDFRHNQLTGVTEYRPKEEDVPFRPIVEQEKSDGSSWYLRQTAEFPSHRHGIQA